MTEKRSLGGNLKNKMISHITHDIHLFISFLRNAGRHHGKLHSIVYMAPGYRGRHFLHDDSSPFHQIKVSEGIIRLPIIIIGKESFIKCDLLPVTPDQSVYIWKELLC